jgi:hypothetical protein
MVSRRIQFSRVAKRAEVRPEFVQRVLGGTASPSDRLVEAFAEILQMDLKRLRQLRGLDRGAAMRRQTRINRLYELKQEKTGADDRD